MAGDTFEKYIAEINKAYLRGDATEHTHRPALKALIESIDNKATAVNEPRRIKCGAPDLVVSRRVRRLDQNIGYIECKDIGTNLNEAAKSEQIKKRYLPSLRNFILTDYIEFWWYVGGKMRLKARLANEAGGKFKATEEGKKEVAELLGLFLKQEPEKITTAKELAVRMADLARLLRDITRETFKQEEERGTLHGQFEAFRQVLIHDLTEEQFADMYAQTISYGLFTSRCHIEDMTVFGQDKYAAFHGMNGQAREFTREHAAYLLPKTNPFLRKAFAHIAGPDLDDRISWLVDDIVALLRQADMGVILRDFARRKKRKDPVVHFYETFLAEYDPKLRKKRGVYYTPDEVVSYIVRSVDYLLKEKFGLKRGLADESKIKVDSRLRGNDKKEVHKVLILDPAVGTGTFLFEAIDQIHKKFKGQKGMWSGYVREHLLPRLFGFEIQMAPYAVCHMKLGLQLAETGYDFGSDERLGIYLTNTLEEAEETTRTLFAQWLSEEATAANKVKKDLPIMVILGNPPYAGISANRGEWITNLIKSYREVDGQPLGEKKVWVKNDYVKFIRFGQWRIEQTGYGILGFITDHSYLDSPTFRGMRRSLMNTFGDIYILNLHGNSKRRERTPSGGKDESVFDIMEGTAITLLVRNGGHETTQVYYADIWGKREGKYQVLAETDAEQTDWISISPTGPFYDFLPRDHKLEEEYDSAYKVTQIFPKGSNGVQTSRDQLAVDFDNDSLRKRIIRFCDLRISEARIRAEFFGGKAAGNYHPGDTREWLLSDARKKLQNKALWKDAIIPYLYRPFDKRCVVYSQSIVDWPRHDVMRHLQKKNVALCVGRAGLVRSGDWDLAYCTSHVCDHNIFYRGSSLNFPLYLYVDGNDRKFSETSDWKNDENGRSPNLLPEFVAELGRRVGLEFVSDGHGELRRTFGPEDVFDYIYGLLHSPEYRRRYAEFLNIDFPRVPWPKNREIFKKVCWAGEELVKLHLMEAEVLEEADKRVLFDVKGGNIVEKGYPEYVAHADTPEKGRVYINKDQFFEGVRPEVWEFHIGGYQVCEKWLKDRRGKELSYEDQKHYQKIVVALGETIRLMIEPCLSEMFEEGGHSQF
jgi:type I restriction-modification system DNA methylase subunit